MIDISFKEGEAAYLRYSNFRYEGACSFLGKIMKNSKPTNSIEILGVQLERLNGWLVKIEPDYPNPERINLVWKDENRDYSFLEKDNLGVPIQVMPVTGSIEKIINGLMIEDIVSKVKKFQDRDIAVMKETWQEIASYAKSLRKIAVHN
jgi:hypothetical protein